MASTSNNGFVNWKYGDWRREPTLATQIDRLTRHIEEVEKYAFESQDKGRRLTLHQNMLARLEKNLDRLKAQQKFAASAVLNRTGRVSKFVRGADA